MSLTITPRMATEADAKFITLAVNALTASNWKTAPEDLGDEPYATALSYIRSDEHEIAIVEADWPEKGISNRPVALVHTYRRRRTRRARVVHLAIDPSVIPDRADMREARARIADRMVRRLLANAQNHGTPDAEATVDAGSRVDAYMQTLPSVSRTVKGTRAAYVFDVAQTAAAIDAPSREDFYAALRRSG